MAAEDYLGQMDAESMELGGVCRDGGARRTIEQNLKSDLQLPSRRTSGVSRLMSRFNEGKRVVNPSRRKEGGRRRRRIEAATRFGFLGSGCLLRFSREWMTATSRCARESRRDCRWKLER